MYILRRDRVSLGTSLCRFYTCLLIELIYLRAAFGSDFGFRFVKRPSWQVVNSGDNVTFTCETNLPPDRILWQFNHEYITEFADEGSKIFEFNNDGLERSSLTVVLPQELNDSFQYEGLYQCVASVGSISVTSLPGRLRIASIKPYDEGTPLTQTLEVDEGNVFRVTCGRPQSFPKARLRFFHNGNLLKLDEDESYHVTESGDLVVLNADQSSEGTYTCEAYNVISNRSISSPIKTKVDVNKKSKKSNSPMRPRVATFDSVIEVAEGDRVKLLCLCVHCEGDLYWTRRGSDLAIKRSSDINARLLFIEIDADRERVYRCHVNNSLGYAYTNLRLLVERAPVVTKGLESQSVYEKANLVLECSFDGEPTPAVSWVFNGRLLTNSSVLENRIELKAVEKSQAGIYQCFGFNNLGSAEATSVVNVIPRTITASIIPDDKSTFGASSQEREIDILLESEDDIIVENDTNKNKKKFKEERKQRKKMKKVDMKRKMIAPSKPNVTKVSDESVMVTWELKSENGLPVSFFKVQYKVLEGPEKDSIGRRWKTIDEDISPHVKSFEVTGLRSNHLYRFRVLAVYVNDDNQPGESSKRFFLAKDIKLRPPERAPEILFLLPIDETTLKVFWRYEATRRTAGFIIYYRESTIAVDFTTVTILNPDKRNYNITHLRPDRPYDFKMTSFNMAGISRFSNKKSYHPKGMNFTNEEYEDNISSSVVPVVRSEPEFVISSHVLYIALGSGLGFLVLIVITYYTIYSCRKRNADISDSKFADASLRIHRNSTGDLRQLKQGNCIFSDSIDNQIPLLASAQSQGEKKNDSPTQVQEESESVKENGNVKVFKETSFLGNNNPPNMYGEIG